MRNRVVAWTILASALSASALVAGQDPSTGIAGKIGVINIQQAIASTTEGKAALGELQKKYEPKRLDLQKRQDEISSLTDQLQKQSATLSDDERSRLSRELDDKQRV